jgi:hypothetical protein
MQATGSLNDQLTFTFSVAYDQPVSGFDDPASDVRLDHSGTTGGEITITAIDGMTYNVVVAGITGNGSFALIVVQGAATDALGTASPAGSSPRVPVDTIAPTVNVDKLATNDTTPRLTGTVDEPATISVNVAGKTYAAVYNANGTWTLPDDLIDPPLSAGVYDVSVNAVDAAGNASAGVFAAALTIDLTAPVVGMNALTTNRRRPTLTGTINDPTATVTARIGDLSLGTAVHNGDGTWALNSVVDVPDGTHTVVATARDAAGNATDASAQLVLDATAPQVTVDVLATADTTPPLSGTVDDATAVVQVTVAGKTYPAANFAGRWSIADDTIAPPLAVGWYDVVVAATDTFGNVGHDTTDRELRVTDGPVVEAVSLATDNRSMMITFDQGVYGDAAHSTPIDVSDLALAFVGSPHDPVTGVTMTGIRHPEGGSLLGTSRVVVDLQVTGGPTLGLSFITIHGQPGAVWNAQGQVATKLSTGYLRLRDPRNLLNEYEWSFDKLMDDSPSIHFRIINGAGTTDLFHTGMRSLVFMDPIGSFESRSLIMPDDQAPFQRIPIVPGGTYRLSAWVYVKSNTYGVEADLAIRLQLRMARTSGDPVEAGASVTAPAMDSWQQVEQVVQAPADANGWAWLVLRTADFYPNDSDLYVDDLRVEAVAP